MKDLLKFSMASVKCVLPLLTVVFSFYSCNKQLDYLEFTHKGAALGTSYSIKFMDRKPQNMQLAIDSVFAAVNQSLSTYIPESDISKINQGDSTLAVDAMFQEVFQLSKKIHRATNGYFDPTVGPLVNAWGFGPGKQLEMDSTRVDSLLKYVGFEKVDITASNTVVKKDKAIYFDFNAVAKGYAIDRLAVLLDEKGIDNYLLEVGGELVAKGVNKAKNKAWVVGVDDPQAGDLRAVKILLYLNDKALASSGNYRKFRIDSLSGKKYVHTIDPKTGYTKNTNVLAATVIADQCAKADAYATAFMAMELDDTIGLLVSNQSLEAYIIYLDEEGNTKEFMTDGFKEVLVPEEE